MYLVVGWVQGLFALLALILLLTAAYKIGQRSAQPPTAASNDLKEILATPAPLPAARPQVAAPTPAQGGSGGPVATPLSAPRPAETVAAKPSPPPASVPRKDVETGDPFDFASGSYYVVVQHFRTRDRDQAIAAKEFLRSKGVPAVIRPGSGDLELVATEAFASEQAAQKNLVRRILDLGKEYWNSGGGYEFTGTKARKF